MNGSEINKILNGLYAGGTGLAAGLIDKADKNKPKDLYEKESAYLKSTYQGAIENANKILNPDATTGGVTTPITPLGQDNRINPATGETMPDQSPAPVQDNTIKPAAPTAPNINDLYARREKAIMDLSGMKYGAPYAESLNRLYKDHLDPQSDWEIKEGKDGQFFAINKKNFQVKNITEPAPKEKEFSTKNWDIFLDDSGKPYYGERVEKDGKVQIVFKDNLNKAELDDWNYDNELKAKNLAPKTSSRAPGRRTSGPKKLEKLSFADSQLEKKVKDYAELKSMDWGSMSIEQQDKYARLNKEIERMSGENADDLTNRVVNSEDMRSELKNLKETQADLGNQDKETDNEVTNILTQYASGDYDKADLEKSAYEWLDSLAENGVDPSIIDKARKRLDTYFENHRNDTESTEDVPEMGEIKEQY